MITRMATMRSRYPNFGKPWYRHDHLRLEYGLEKNLSLTVLCENLGRNPSAIVRQLVSKGLLRRGRQGDVIRYCHQAREWRVWATVRRDVIIMDNFMQHGGMPYEGEEIIHLRAQFELSVTATHPRISLKRDPYSAGSYMFAEAQDMWALTLGIFASLKDDG